MNMISAKNTLKKFLSTDLLQFLTNRTKKPSFKLQCCRVLMARYNVIDKHNILGK